MHYPSYAVYQVALVTKHILPAALPLKHLFYHLAHLGGKIILPAPLFPVTSAVSFAETVRDAFQRAVAAEKDFSMQQQQRLADQRRRELQQMQKRLKGAEADGEEEETQYGNTLRGPEDLSLTVAGLYSPYAKSNEDLIGPMSVQEDLGGFLNKNRGKHTVPRFLLFIMLTFLPFAP